MAALHCLFNLNSQGFEMLNSANIVLLPKKSEALRVTDFRPISLIHSIAKIFSKLLSNRHAPHMNSLVSNYQSAFIKYEASMTTSSMSREQYGECISYICWPYS